MCGYPRILSHLESNAQVAGSWDRAAKVAEQSSLSPPLPVSCPRVPHCASHVMPGPHLPGTDFCVWTFSERPAFSHERQCGKHPYERDSPGGHWDKAPGGAAPAHSC